MARKLKIKSETHMTDDRRLVYWLLPGQKIPGHEPELPAGDGPTLEEMFAELNYKYPGDPLESRSKEV